MAGVVAAGQRETAEAGAAILRRGGNAVDAAIAACAAAFVAEPLLASAGGAGIMTVVMPGHEPVVVDFFSDMPGRGRAGAGADTDSEADTDTEAEAEAGTEAEAEAEAEAGAEAEAEAGAEADADAEAEAEAGAEAEADADAVQLAQPTAKRPTQSAAAYLDPKLDFWAIEVDFGVSRQEFHVGRASAAVPGALPGLAEAHARFGSLSLAELMAPAMALATGGVPASAGTVHVFGLLWPILARCPDVNTALTGSAARPRPGDRLCNPALAQTLAEFAALGRTPDRVLAGLLDRFGPQRGGLITEHDVRAYRPRVHAPRRARVGGGAVLAPTAPGGELALRIMRQLVDAPPAGDEAAEVVRHALASRAGHAHRRLLTGPGNTTHISVIDGQGGAVSVTLTNGEGCGHLIPGTGIQVNNFLGEEDLNPHGFHRHAPGRRLPTMIAPAVAVRGGRPCLALGSGGSNRIRSAVGQVLYRSLVGGQGLAEAVAAPRVHAEDDTVWVETEGLRDPGAAVVALERAFGTVHVFERCNFFFGGVHAVAVDGAGHIEGVGDQRRGGLAVRA